MAEIKNKDMTFDKVRGRYMLTEDYVRNELGMDLQTILLDEFDANPTTLPKRTIKYTSNMVYDYMQRNCANYKFTCELINTVPHINEAFKEALGYQLMSFAQEGDKAFSADGSIEKSICQRTLQVLLANRLLTVQKPINRSSMATSYRWDIEDDWAERGGGVF